MIKIPADKWIAAHNGEKYGNIIRTKNISLDKDGLIQLARKAMVLESLENDAGFTSPTVIETDGTYAYVLNGGSSVFVIDLTADAFSIVEASQTNSPTLGDDSDLVIFNDKPHASGGAKVGYLNAFGQGQLWHNPSPITDLSTTYPHPMCNFQNNNLFVADGNVLRQYDTSYTRDTSNELTIGAQYIITSVRARGSKLYIGTRNKYGGEARYFEWNRVGTSAQNSWGCGADWIYSQCDFDSSIAIITSAGQLKRFNGAGFDEFPGGNLPVYYTPFSWASTVANTSLIGKVASRGMGAIGDTLYINIDGSLNQNVGVYPGKYIPQQPSGLWCYDKKSGLSHRAGYNYRSKLRNLMTAVAANIVTFTSAHQCLTGDAMLYVGGEVTGLTSGQVYYAITVTATTLQFALSPADAAAGRAITISSAGVTTSRCYFDTYDSVAETSISKAGGLLVMGRNALHGFYGSEVMFSGVAIDETQTDKGTLMSLGMGRNVGSFITPKIYSDNILDTYKKIAAFFESLFLATDQIIIKYRKAKKSGYPLQLCFTGSATWIAANQFSIDMTKKDILSLVEGEEIEIVEGANAGFSGHISAGGIQALDGGIYYITIDETLPLSSGSFDFTADNWVKLAAVTKDSEDSNDNYADPSLTEVKSKWVEFKIELRGRGVTIEELQFINSPQKISQ